MESEEYLIMGFSLITWTIGACFLVRSGIHFIKMLSHFRSKKHDIAGNLLPWLTPFLPIFYTDEGNHHRGLFLKNLGLAFIFMALFAGIIMFKESYV